MDLDTFLNTHVKNSTQQQWFVHFTDRANLASIKQHGLLSTRELKRRGISTQCGGNQWSLDRDIASGMDAYVHLCFKTGHPMEKNATDGGTIKNLVHLKVKSEVIKLPGVLITNDVSNKVGVKPGLPADILDSIDLEVLYKRMKWQGEVLDRLKIAEKCEILIPTELHPKYIFE